MKAVEVLVKVVVNVVVHVVVVDAVEIVLIKRIVVIGLESILIGVDLSPLGPKVRRHCFSGGEMVGRTWEWEFGWKDIFGKMVRRLGDEV